MLVNTGGDCRQSPHSPPSSVGSAQHGQQVLLSQGKAARQSGQMAALCWPLPHNRQLAGGSRKGRMLFRKMSIKFDKSIPYWPECPQYCYQKLPNTMNQPQTITLKRHTPHPQNDQWSQEEVEALFALPFNDLLFAAQEVHRSHFDPNRVQLSALLSIKTGNCSEDCGYCSQSNHHTGAKAQLEHLELMSVEDVIAIAKVAKENGASRFCMGAAWRGPKRRHLDEVKQMVIGVKALGLETCATLGLLLDGQAEELKAAGLDYYNHNLDTAEEKYTEIVTTHSHADRLDTLGKLRNAGLSICCGGIIGMGETRPQRAALIRELANLSPAPESVPINNLVPIEGTPLADIEPIDWTEFVRTIAVARITMPASYVRLSAGRGELPEAAQALCFLAGANSIFYGEKLLTTGNPDVERDRVLLQKLDLQPL